MIYYLVKSGMQLNHDGYKHNKIKGMASIKILSRVYKKWALCL